MEYNDFKEFDAQRKRELEYKKDQHVGAEKTQCLRLVDIEGYIYGINESDPSKSESGVPHIHFETPNGESEYYFTYNPISLTYKDGVKLSDDDYAKILDELNRYEKICDNINVSICYMIWNCSNNDNEKCTML
jgi:hypothetical protein